jgi:hypothetical protein
MFNSLPPALQYTASLSWRCSPQAGQENRTLPGESRARARFENCRKASLFARRLALDEGDLGALL